MSKQIPYDGQSLASFPSIPRMAHLTMGSDTDNDVVLSSTGVYHLFDLKAGVVVHEVAAQIRTAFTTSVALNIGDSDVTNGYITDTDLAPQTTTALLHSTKTDTAAGTLKGGKYYEADQSIDVVVSGATVAAGKADVYLFFSQAGLD